MPKTAITSFDSYLRGFQHPAGVVSLRDAKRHVCIPTQSVGTSKISGYDGVKNILKKIQMNNGASQVEINDMNIDKFNGKFFS